MKFIITRTSEWGDDRSPCIEAKREQVVETETRTFRSPEEFDKKRAASEGPWLSVGTNHRIGRNCYICRDIGTKSAWTIDINSIEELANLSQKYGEIIISDCRLTSEDKYPTLEIYDDYRE